MRNQSYPNRTRSLGVTLAALTVAVPLALAVCVPAQAALLAPLALALPFATMALLDAALRDDGRPVHG
jgi:hypothetical protein